MAEAPKNAQKGVGMEGFIAKWYARQTARDIEEFKATARRIAPHIGPSARVLEIAPGERIDAIGERGSRVRFRVEFEFKNRLIAAALSAAFEALCSTIVDAFVLRAQKIYG